MADLVHYVDMSGGPIAHEGVFGADWTVVQERVTCPVCLAAIERPAQTIDGVTLTPGDRILIRQGPFRWGAWLRFVVRRPWRVRTVYRAWRRRKRAGLENGVYVVSNTTWLKP